MINLIKNLQANVQMLKNGIKNGIKRIYRLCNHPEIYIYTSPLGRHKRIDAQGGGIQGFDEINL